MSLNFSLPSQTIDPRAQSLFNEAEALLEAQHYEEAAKLYQQSIAIQDHEDSQYKLGLCMEMAGKKDAALKAYRKCTTMNPYHLGALENAGDIYVSSGQGLLAIECYGMAIIAHPDLSGLKEKLIGVLSFQTFKAMGEPLRNIVLECMKDPKTDLSYMTLGWLSICETIPAFQNVYKTARFITYDDFERNFAALPHYKGLYEEFFLTGLARVFVADLKFERFLTHLRRYCLENPDFWQDSPELSAFVATLADYAFLTEYVFALENSEEAAIEALEQKGPAQTLSRSEIIILACYRPLQKVDGIEQSVKAFQDDPLIAKLVDRQITQENALYSLRSEVSSLTAIDNEVSRKVQEQYEESPYPRWNGFSKSIKPAEEELWGKNADILIAGCGTGREAIELAYCFPDAHVLAVDLSRSSIAYGMLKAKEYGISNITFKHGDILGLGILDKKFDLITSSGVLHHMQDPMAGWRVITGLLKPKGLMRIALYSAHARQSINTARKIIRDEDIPADLPHIRAFRAEAKNKLPRADYEAITLMRDYYTTSECRDLLFHVQEHQFTIPQIKNSLDTLGLEFENFYLAEKILARYRNRFKNDPAGVNLDQWDQYEKTYPHTFIEMYKFWCRKNG